MVNLADKDVLFTFALMMPQEKGVFLKMATKEERDAFFEIFWHAQILMSMVVVAYAVMCWEFLLHLPAELRTLRLVFTGHFLPARVAVLAVRYTCLAAITNAGVFFWGQGSNCQAMTYFLYAAYSVLWASASSVSLMRLSILFQRRRLVMYGYYAIYLACFGTWISVTLGMKAFRLPLAFQLPHVCQCMLHRASNIFPAAWAASLVFDLAVVGGMTFQLRVMGRAKEGSTAKSKQWLWMSNLFYFAVSACLNLSCLLASILVVDPILSHITMTIAFPLHTTVATRLVLDAKGWSQGGGGLDGHEHSFRSVGKRSTRHARGGPKNGIHFVVDETVITSVVSQEIRDQNEAMRMSIEGEGRESRGPQGHQQQHQHRQTPSGDGIQVTHLPSYGSLHGKPGTKSLQACGRPGSGGSTSASGDMPASPDLASPQTMVGTSYPSDLEKNGQEEQEVTTGSSLDSADARLQRGLTAYGFFADDDEQKANAEAIDLGSINSLRRHQHSPTSERAPLPLTPQSQTPPREEVRHRPDTASSMPAGSATSHPSASSHQRASKPDGAAASCDVAPNDRRLSVTVRNMANALRMHPFVTSNRRSEDSTRGPGTDHPRAM